MWEVKTIHILSSPQLPAEMIQDLNHPSQTEPIEALQLVTTPSYITTTERPRLSAETRAVGPSKPSTYLLAKKVKMTSSSLL